mgnify:CR=1 FL=1
MSKAVLEVPAWLGSGRRLVMVIIEPTARDDTIEQAIEEFINRMIKMALMQVITAIPSTIQVGGIESKIEGKHLGVALTFLDRVSTFAATWSEDNEGIGWLIDIPVFKNVFYSPYLVVGLKKLVELVRSMPDSETLFIETEYILSKIVGMRMKAIYIMPYTRGTYKSLSAVYVPV